MDEASMAEVVQRIYTRNYSSLAAMGVLLADYSATYESEFAYVWKKPVTPVKVAFFLARYLAIFGQGYNCYTLLRILSPDRIPIDANICRISVRHQVLLAFSLHFISDLILAKRIIGLYSYHRLVRYGLIIFLVIQMVCLAASIPIQESQAIWSIACEIQPKDFSVVGSIISAALTLSHCLIWFITTSKRRVSFAVLLPSTSISLRDGAWAALFYLSIFLSVTPHSLVAKSMRMEFQFIWPSTLMSIMTCRLILNTREEYLDDDVATSNDTFFDVPSDTRQSQDTLVHKEEAGLRQAR